MARSTGPILPSFEGRKSLTGIRKRQLQTTRGRSDVSPQGPRIARRATASRLYERPPFSWEAVFVLALIFSDRGRSLVGKPGASNAQTRVRFPSPALGFCPTAPVRFLS